jgi:hypothetical protein
MTENREPEKPALGLASASESLRRLMPVDLAIGLYRVTLEAQDAIELASFAAATLRGAFAWSFKSLVCYQPHVKQCSGCLLRSQCPYPQVFEPAPRAHTLYTGLQNVPAPYVLRPPAGDRHLFAPGEHFAFELVLMGHAIRLLPYFAVALQQVEQRGLGRTRGRARIVSIDALPPPPAAGDAPPGQRIFDAAAPDLVYNHAGWPAAAWVSPTPAPPAVIVEFQTLTRLKSEGRLQTEPAFHVLYRALLRRASALCTYHAGQPWETDFAGLAQAARTVRAAALRGCRGRMVYTGELASFWPLLQLGQVIHAGKNSTFGLGRYRLVDAG